MRIENILNFFEEATKADLILTIIVTVIILLTIIEIFVIGRYAKKIYKMQKLEFKIIEQEFARINPNQYVTNYSMKDEKLEQKTNSTIDSI